MTLRKKIAILAGGGTLPKECAEALLAEGHNVIHLSFLGQPQPEDMPKLDKWVMPIGAVGKILATLKKENVTHILMVGYLDKVSLFKLKPDLKGMAFLAKYLVKHDDALLRGLIRLFQQEGFDVLSVKDVAPNLLMPKGYFSSTRPTKQDLQDIETGMKMLRHMGPLDIGQALIIKHGVVLGVEAIEGTQALIERCAPLRQNGQGGVLVKISKPLQTDKADLPTVGAQTLGDLSRHGYAGLAVEAGQVLALDFEEMQRCAEDGKLFFEGVC